jgi:serine protease Do
VNVAVAEGAQNIGFALPINLVKDSLKTFNETGKFASKAFLGVRYKMIGRDLALLNEIPEGAYVQDVVSDSPSDKAGVKTGDIITKIDGVKITEQDGGLAKVISGKKVGDMIELNIWRDEKEVKIKIKLGEQSQ